MVEKGTTRESDKFMLRLPEGMRARIKTVADINRRSMNAEIVDTLSRRYPPPPSAERLVTQIVDIIGLAKDDTRPNVAEQARILLVEALDEFRWLVERERRLANEIASFGPIVREPRQGEDKAEKARNDSPGEAPAPTIRKRSRPKPSE